MTPLNEARCWASISIVRFCCKILSGHVVALKRNSQRIFRCVLLEVFPKINWQYSYEIAVNSCYKRTLILELMMSYVLTIMPCWRSRETSFAQSEMKKLAVQPQKKFASCETSHVNFFNLGKRKTWFIPFRFMIMIECFIYDRVLQNLEFSLR